MLRAQQYNQLPEPVKQFLFDTEKGEAAQAAIEKVGISPDVSFDVLLLAEDIVLKNIKLGELIAKIQLVAKVEEPIAKAAARELLVQRLLPLEAYVPDVATEITRLGGDPTVKVDRVAKRRLSPETFVRETLNNARLRLPDDVLQSRLEFILTSYVRGVRTLPQTLAIMAKSAKVGGLELPEEQAKKMMAVIDERRATVDIEAGSVPPAPSTPAPSAPPTPPPPAKPVSVPQTPVRPTPPPPAKPRTPPPASTPAPRPSFATVEDVDEAEVKRVEKKMKASATDTTSLSVDGAVERVLSETKVVFPASDLMNRYKSLVMTRMRDLRDAMETKSLLASPIDKGGLALTGTELATVVATIETVFSELRGKQQQGVSADKQKYVERKQQEAGQRAELGKKEEELLAKRYAVLTGKAPVTPAAPTAPTSARVSAAQPKAEEMARASSKVDAPAQAVLRQSAPRPAAVLPKLSPGSVPPGVVGEKPQMADVKYVQKLAGPVEELRRMNPVDFRRLASDPIEAATKLQDKVDLLGQESYEKRVEGVKAWRESPLNQMYVAMSREALLTGKNVAQVAEQWKAAGKDGLTAEEVKAIVGLNTTLRF